MSHTMIGPKALGLCLLAVLSVMAFTASRAQALPGHVYVNLAILKTTVEIEALKPTQSIFLSTIAGGTSIEVACAAVLLHDGLLFTNGTSLGEFLFSSCGVLVGGLEVKNCQPLEPIVIKVKNLLLHHNNDTYLLISPHNAASLTLTTIHLGELCAAGETFEVKGHTVAECGLLLGAPAVWHHEDCNVEKVEHEIKQTPAALFPNHKLQFGARPATLDGDIDLVTKGTNHVGKKWALEALLP
jgi:hypothetical protein